MTNEPTLTEALRAAGFGHRSATVHQPHEVFRAADGVVVGRMHASEAWEFLRSLPKCTECDTAGGHTDDCPGTPEVCDDLDLCPTCDQPRGDGHSTAVCPDGYEPMEVES